MNRQSNLKIIITTVIVLVIAAIAIFTVVNWAEIVKKFQGAAAKADGIEKHERNTVPPTNHTNAFTANTDEWKDIPSSHKEDTKLPNNTQIDVNSKNPSKEDSLKTNSKLKEKDPYGLEEPPIISPKDSGIGYKYTHNDEYPMGNDSSLEPNNSPFNKKTKVSAGKKYTKKKYKRKSRYSKTRLAKVKNLDKRVSYLEKKLGIKNSPKKKPSLEKRIYQLEKLIVKKKN
ncbi:MAG: hypothetical protein KBF93_26875 [Leptospiraceae bacterium]|nr:hypothetical protein [Leptospiraceae bacterium]